MIVLAIDSSGASASAALTDGEKLLAVCTSASQQKHSVTLMPMVRGVLDCVGITIGDVELFAVNSGPGSFTGVRIGISLVKGLAFGSGKPVASVSSLEALAYNLRGFDGIACPVMDARRGQFYNALFRNGERLTPDRLISAADLKAELAKFDCDVRFAGDGYELAYDSIHLPNVRQTPRELTVSSAYSTAVVAKSYYEKNIGIFTDTEIQPVYLRPSQAERERKEREKGEK